MVFRVRSAAVDDAAAIIPLNEALGYPADLITIKERLHQLVADPDQLIIVAENSLLHVIGWLHIGRHISLEGGEKAEIFGLVVSPEVRRKGVARQLVKAVEEWAISQDLSVVVRSNITRPEAHTFYERSGFTRIKTQHVYRKDAS